VKFLQSSERKNSGIIVSGPEIFPVAQFDPVLGSNRFIFENPERAHDNLPSVLVACGGAGPGLW